jgi:hypothetical protein
MARNAGKDRPAVPRQRRERVEEVIGALRYFDFVYMALGSAKLLRDSKIDNIF